MLKDADEHYSAKLQELEGQAELQQKKQYEEIQEIQAKSEEALAQLKNFYEVERERLEHRVLEERDKNDTRVKALEEDYETKLKEITCMHEEEFDNLQGDLQENESQSTDLLQKYEHDLSLKTQ